MMTKSERFVSELSARQVYCRLFSFGLWLETQSYFIVADLWHREYKGERHR